MQTRRQFLKATGIAAATVSGAFFHCRKKETRPNVIILLSDELTFEFLSCYGGTMSTPNIDRLASDGLKFTNAYSAAPMCTPSRFSIMTGQYPGRCAHQTFLQEFPKSIPYSIAWNTWLGQNNTAITKRLSEGGYFTGITGKWHIGEFDADRLIPQFDPDDDPADPEVDEKLRQHQSAVVAQVKKDTGCNMAINVSWNNFDSFPVKKLRFHNFPWINQGAIQFLDAAVSKQQPFFLYAATTAVHGPAHQNMLNADLSYTPGGRDEEVLNYLPDMDDMKQRLDKEPEWKRHQIAGVASLDHHVGLILDKLDELEIADNTMVFFVADHNVEPGKATCYEKGNRIPMIIKWPLKIQQSLISNALVQTVDIAPTILEAAGLKMNDKNLDGQSLVHIFNNPSDKHHDFIYLESGYTRAITDGHLKYIIFRPPVETIKKMKSGKFKYAPNHLNVFKQAHSQIAIEHFPHYFDPDQLYDLEKDPYEQNNVIDDQAYTDRLAVLKSKLKERLDSFSHPFATESDSFMRTPGYIQYAQNTRDIGTDFIPWLRRDHGKIVYPPVK